MEEKRGKNGENVKKNGALYKDCGRSGEPGGQRAYLLYLFGPLRGVTECHEYTVGQNGAHDDHAEERAERQGVKENCGRHALHTHTTYFTRC